MRTSHPFVTVTLFVVAVLFLSASQTDAEVLDWSTVTWNPNSLTHTFANVDNSGVDIRVSLSGNTNAFSGSPNQYPIVSNSPHTGGISPAPDSLYLRIDSFNNKNQSIQVTIEFFKTGTTTAVDVSNVYFTMFDVDRGSSAGGGTYTFQDQVKNFRAQSTSSSTYSGPTSVTGSSANSISGSGITFAATGTQEANSNSSAGNVTVNFGSQQVSSLRFWYGNGNSSQQDPDLQSIALYDINFTVVPEAGTVLGVGLCFLLAISLHRFHHRREAATELPLE